MSMGNIVGKSSDYGMNDEQYWRMRSIFDVQSVTFTCEILPSIYELFPEGNHELTLLDVGARTGAGAGLIAYLHQKYAFSRLKIDVTALDIDNQYVRYAKAHYPHAKYIVQDISNPDFNTQYDIVLASHTIEHVPFPDEFMGHLKRLARKYVVVACPYEEEKLIQGHRNRIGSAFFQRHSVQTLRVYDSVAWTGSKACVAVIRT